MDSLIRDRIISTERRRYRNRLFFSALGVMIAPLGVPVTFIAERGNGWPPVLAQFPLLYVLLSVGAGLLIVAFGIALNIAHRDAELPQVIEHQIETIQNRHRNLLIVLAAIPLFLAALLTLLPSLSHEFFGNPQQPGRIRLFVAMVVSALPVVLIGLHRPGRDTYHGVPIYDELTRDLRLQSIRIGYAAVMLALAGAYVWFLGHPADAAVVLPWILAGGIAIPIWAFAFLHWRTGRDQSHDE